jgi:hypothetical protein
MRDGIFPGKTWDALCSEVDEYRTHNPAFSYIAARRLAPTSIGREVTMSNTLDRTHLRLEAVASPMISAERLRRTLLACGLVGAAFYPLADILASWRYPGFSYRDQAVSELFAIGAPTSDFLVPLFTISSVGILLFSLGIWVSAHTRLVRVLAVMMALNAVNALALWNFFPMHMRGVEPAFTDMMHGLLAIDPFLLIAIILAAIAFPGRFRAYTITTIVVSTALALTAVKFVPAVIANEPTPWMGAAERAGQYLTNLWYAVFAVMLMRRSPAPAGTDRSPNALA